MPEWTLQTVQGRPVRVKTGTVTPPPGGGTGEPPPVDTNTEIVTRLKMWTEAEAYQFTAITYNSTTTDVIQAATVQWPDGSAGAWTTTAHNATWHEVDGFTITHVASGKTVTQPNVTRNASGLITVKPPLTVTP